MDTRILLALQRYHYISKPLVATIAKDPQWAYWYAKDILKGPFPLGEPAIAKESWRAFWYAAEILKDPFPLGEPAIAKDPQWAYYYALDVLEGPFPLGEPAIANSGMAFLYARIVLKLPEDQAKQWSKK